MTEPILTYGEVHDLIKDMRQVRDEYVSEMKKCGLDMGDMFQEGDNLIKHIDSNNSKVWGQVKYGDVLNLFSTLRQESKKCFAKVRKHKAKINDSNVLACKQKGVNEAIAALGQRVGQYIELTDIVRGVGRVGEQFRNLGYKLVRVEKRVDLVDCNNKKKGDIDLLLECDDVLILIEIKLPLTKEKVEQYMNNLKKYHPRINTQGKKCIVAVAGVKIKDGAMKYAHSQGLHVLNHDGNNFNIVPTPKDFKPKEW